MLDSEALILESFGLPAKIGRIQEFARVALNDIAEIRQLSYIIEL